MVKDNQIKLVCKILYKDRVLADASREVNGDLLDMIRERDFNLRELFTNPVDIVVKKALEVYDAENKVKE